MSTRHVPSLRTLLRLSRGTLRLPASSNRGKRADGWGLISFDIFGTLVHRIGDEHSARTEGALRVVQVARSRGLTVTIDPLALRDLIELRLSRTMLESGRDPEFPLRSIHAETLRYLGGQAWVEQEAHNLAERELEHELRYLRANAPIQSLLNSWSKSGRRIVAVSDTRYTSDQLATLLSRLGIVRFHRIYSSADHGASKFSGRLFDLVVQEEHVSPSNILHIGDDIFTDAIAPAERGIAVRRVVRPPNPAPLPAPPERVTEQDSAFDVGYHTLGPILVGFTRLLFDRARRDGIKRLAFVARDGELLLQVAKILSVQLAPDTLELSYLHLSRRAMASSTPELLELLAKPQAIEQVIAPLKNIRGFGNSLQSFQSYYNIPDDLISPHSARLKLQNGDLADLRLLLADPQAAQSLIDAVVPMRDRLHRYLIQENVLDERTALVDIGWRASLQKLIESESKVWQSQSPRGYYLGLWNESPGDFPAQASGLITDQRRGRSLREGSAWHAAFLLEAVCRASHGMVTGFCESESGEIRPLHVDNGGTRVAERASESTQKRIQEGILEYARWFTSSYPIIATDESAIRRSAQHRLYKLAFFPTQAEIEIGRQLIYSEPTSDESAMHLIGADDAGLLAGLRSPWKGGYIRSRLGWLGAASYCGAEGLLSFLPKGSKPAIRRVLLRNE